MQVEAEVLQLSEAIGAIAPYAELLPTLRGQHAELTAQADEAQRLMRDVDVSKLQVQLAAQLRLGTEGAEHGVALDEAAAAAAGSDGGNGNYAPGKLSASGPEEARPLAAVFTRLRELEAQALELGSENDDLKALNAELQAQLQASAEALGKLRHVAAAMGTIRGAQAGVI